MSKINKALDLNKLFQEQKLGRLTNKKVSFPVLASIKYDGNYVVVKVVGNKVEFTTSGGLSYTHTDNGGDIFKNINDGYYLAERIYDKGLLGQRFKCNLWGPKKDQTSTGHTYKVFDFISIDDYNRGKTKVPFYSRYVELCKSGIPEANIVTTVIVSTQGELDNYLARASANGYEGIMFMDPDWCWSDTTSRTVSFGKYKKRPTIDLLCIDVKYSPVNPADIGSVIVTDKEGRTCAAGGLPHKYKAEEPSFFIGKIVEVEYEQLLDTYIQPVFVDFRTDTEVD